MHKFLQKMFSSNNINFKELLANGAIVLDVRSVQEYQNGHIENAINIPINTLEANLNKLDKTKPIITCCLSGTRSSYAEKLLNQHGFIVYNGGGWSSLCKRI